MTTRARSLLLALLVAPLSAACGSGATPAPAEDIRGPGPYAVGFRMLSLVDEARPTTDAGFTHRPVPVYVWYPVDPGTVGPGTAEASYPLDPFYGQAPVSLSSDWERHGADRAWQGPRPSAQGPFPVVVYSHGFMVPAFPVALGARLASHGIVFAAVMHLGDDSFFPWYPPEHTWRWIIFDRPRDVSFALTALLARNGTPGDPFQGLLRPDQVAAAGFSMGGYAALALAAGDDDVCDIPDVPPNANVGPVQPGDPCVPTPPDPRFRAIVPMDGANQGLHTAELKRVAVPSLILGRDWGSLASQSPVMAPWQARPHALVAGRPALRVNVVNSAHDGSFGERCTQLPVFAEVVPGFDNAALREMIRGSCTGYTPWAEVRDVVGEYTIAFLRQVLQGDGTYAQVLTPSWTLANEPYVQLFESERIPASQITSEWPDDDTYYKHMSEVP
ncbi:MAG TPA: hypothetical protein VFM53_00645 [Anaeromyxobacteraceae bacterium]|nr:hypothetical protein [Anaeromyxobacteraceae bacterium]